MIRFRLSVRVYSIRAGCPRYLLLTVLSGLALCGQLWASPAVVQEAVPAGGSTAIAQEALQLMDTGEYEAAWKKLDGNSDPYSLRLLLELSLRKGEREEADRYARYLLSQRGQGKLRTAGEVSQAAFAAWKLGRPHEANAIYLDASKLTPLTASLYVDWGNLYLEKYNAAEAEAIFQDAIQTPRNPDEWERWGPEVAYLSLARALKAQGKGGSEQALEEATKLAPGSLPLLSYQSEELIHTSGWELAEELIGVGLKANPRYLPLLELKAAYYFFKEEPKKFEKAQEKVLQINPSNGDYFELLGDFCIRRRRLEEGIAFFRESVRRNPEQWSALASLGINLLRMAEEEEGQAVLERAYEKDPFNIWTVNTLRLLDSFENFDRFESEHFRFKLEKSEAQALRPYVEDLLERSITTLAQKYDHPITDKYLFEMYNNHDDFAVRTLGLPGLGALGATFGRVVAMDSPTARPGDDFHWGSTLWHEVAHVVTLSLSRQKVPRWLTEGISMMEERLASKGWGDFITPGFVKAWEEEKLLPLSELNSGFERPSFPGQLVLSYFQAGWLCDFLAEEYGFEKIREMLIAFGDGKSMEDVFKEVLENSVEEVDQGFRQEMEETLRPLAAALKEPEVIEIEDPELELSTRVQAAKKSPDSYPLNLEAAQRLIAAERNEEAVSFLERAIELFPYAAGETSPYFLLAAIYGNMGKTEEQIDVLRRQRLMAPAAFDSCLKLASLLLEQGEDDEAIEVLEGLMFVNPLKAEVHQKLGDAYLEGGKADKAVREFEVLLALNPPDKAGSHYRIASALALEGQSEEARHHVLLALEIAPTYQDAQQLLLKLVRQ